MFLIRRELFALQGGLRKKAKGRKFSNAWASAFPARRRTGIKESDRLQLCLNEVDVIQP